MQDDTWGELARSAIEPVMQVSQPPEVLGLGGRGRLHFGGHHAALVRLHPQIRLGSVAVAGSVVIYNALGDQLGPRWLSTIRIAAARYDRRSEEQGTPQMAQPVWSGDHGEQNLNVLAALDPTNPAYKLSPQESQARQEADMMRTGRIPTLADYRKVYDNLVERHGYRRVSDEEIRRTHLVAP